MGDKQLVSGIAWFQPEQWQRLNEISVDRDGLHDCYEDWRKSASEVFLQLRASGMDIRKVKIDLEALLAWCNEEGVAVNGEARANYVSMLLRSKYNNKQKGSK